MKRYAIAAGSRAFKTFHKEVLHNFPQSSDSKRLAISKWNDIPDDVKILYAKIDKIRKGTEAKPIKACKKPKKPRIKSPYNLFVSSQYQALKTAKNKFGENMKIIGKVWSELSLKEKLSYKRPVVNLGAEKTISSELNQQNTPKNLIKKAKPKSNAKTKNQKHLSLKTARSSYNQFMKDEFPKFHKIGSKSATTFQLLAAKWGELSKQEKESY